MAARWSPSNEPAELVFAVCDLLLGQFRDQYGPPDLPDQGPAPPGRVREEDRLGPAQATAEALQRLGWKSVTRERVYPRLWEGMRRGLVRLQPPRHEMLARNLAYYYHLNSYHEDRERIQVIPVRGERAIEHVATAGALQVLTLIKRLAKAK